MQQLQKKTMAYYKHPIYYLCVKQKISTKRETFVAFRNKSSYMHFSQKKKQQTFAICGTFC